MTLISMFCLQVGEVIASFITILLDTFRYDPECIRIVGVGLGGHIAGIAARSVAVDIPQIIGTGRSHFSFDSYYIRLMVAQKNKVSRHTYF